RGYRFGRLSRQLAIVHSCDAVWPFRGDPGNQRWTVGAPVCAQPEGLAVVRNSGARKPTGARLTRGRWRRPIAAKFVLQNVCQEEVKKLSKSANHDSKRPMSYL